MIDLLYQVTGLASVITFAAVGLAARRWLERVERRQGKRR